ncbi:MAG: NAD+ synthase, partial [Paracoccaceae bacterium]
PYPVLDAILERLVERDQSMAEIVEAGFDKATVKKVEGLLYGAEWKRYQCAPGIRLTQKAFWLDRRYPIVNRWRDEG